MKKLKNLFNKTVLISSVLSIGITVAIVGYVYNYSYKSNKSNTQAAVSKENIQANSSESTNIMSVSNFQGREKLYEKSKLDSNESSQFQNNKQISTNGFADLVDFISPSVVNIYSIKTVKVNNRMALGEIDPFFKEFLKEFIPNEQQERTKKVFSQGSGFIVREDGFIVTNNHVIADSDGIKVSFSDGTTYNGVVYAADPASDIAIIKIEESNLPTIKFGDSNKVRVGEWAITVGSPYNLGWTVSLGVISSTSRHITSDNDGRYVEYLQTDAAINPGNSGGPMLNIKGEVIGVNTKIYSSNGGGSIGIGFAITSNVVKDIVAQLIVNKKVERGHLGVYVQQVDSSLAEALGLPNEKGVLITKIVEDSPAEKAGLKVGDVIVKVNDKEIKSANILSYVISSYAPNEKIKMTIISESKQKVVSVKLEPIPEEVNDKGKVKQKTKKTHEEAKTALYEKIGFRVSEINDDIRVKYGLKEDAIGILITEVINGSIAQYKQVLPGSIILSVNNKLVTTMEHFEKMMKTSSNKLFFVEYPGDVRFFISITDKEIQQGFSDSYYK